MRKCTSCRHRRGLDITLRDLPIMGSCLCWKLLSSSCGRLGFEPRHERLRFRIMDSFWNLLWTNLLIPPRMYVILKKNKNKKPSLWDMTRRTMPLMETELDSCASFHLNPSPIGLMTLALPRTFSFFFQLFSPRKLLRDHFREKRVFFYKGKTVYRVQIARV